MEIIAVIFVALIFSAWLRISQYRQDVEMKTMASPLSLAIQDLIATAGGIYLSITLLVSFLQIIVPDKVVISYLYFFARCYLKDFLIGVPLSFLYGYGIQTCSFVTIGMDHK